MFPSGFLIGAEEGRCMFDEVERLRGTAALQQLLGHYAQAGTLDRDSWQDRLMQLAGVEAQELIQLHGELLAYGWVEQNTGNMRSAKLGAVACCYRVTLAGLRAWQQAPCGPVEDDTGESGSYGTRARPCQSRRAASYRARAMEAPQATCRPGIRLRCTAAKVHGTPVAFRRAI
jgi:hypothetical protein